MNAPPPLIGPAPRVTSSWHHDIQKTSFNRNGPENIISSHPVSHWKPVNQRRGWREYPASLLAERCECWIWKVALNLYSVAEELLPPGCEQKYTHRFLQYIQTELQQRGLTLIKSFNSRFCFLKNTRVTVFILEVNFVFVLHPVCFPLTFCLTSTCLHQWKVYFRTTSEPKHLLWSTAHLSQVRLSWNRSKKFLSQTSPEMKALWLAVRNSPWDMSLIPPQASCSLHLLLKASLLCTINFIFTA